MIKDQTEGLATLESYSAAQIQKACQALPIISHYQQILARPIDSLYAKRHHAFIQCALANYYQTASIEMICKFWSQTADQIISEAWSRWGPVDLPLAVWAAGKLGAVELNLSSDIDLIFVAADGFTLERRLLTNFINKLTQQTEYGFLYRVDTDLRPGGRLGPLVSTVSQFQDYYGNFGETWERLALIRLRPLLGPPEIVEPIFHFVSRFCFRKHLDFSLLEDLKNLRQKIQHQYPTKDDASFNLKLGIGGIRDIELFVHALQVIHGGRIPALRTHSTGEALSLLQAHGVLPKTDAEFLKETYWFLRWLENWVQSRQDQQTHIWSPELTENSLVLAQKIHTSTQKVDQLVSSLLGKVRAESEIPSDLPSQLQWISQHGISSPESHKTWQELLATKVLSRKTEHDERQRLLFLQTFVLELQKIPADQELALSLLIDFCKSIRAKATFFALLNHEPQLIKELAWMFSVSPYLSQLLIARPELIDSYFLKSQAPFSLDPVEAMEQLADFKLLNEIVTSSRFLTEKNLEILTNTISRTADTVCLKILELAQLEIPNSTLSILAMGKWAGQELGLRSDLDFVFLSTRDVTDCDHKVARRVVNRLTQKNRGGALYTLDLRLRPSGNAGLVVVPIDRLESYLKCEAKIWERQAYLKSRLLPNDTLPTRSWALTKAPTDLEFQELSEIKDKLLRQNIAKGENMDLKFSPGGLIDIEFLYQWTCLYFQVVPKQPSTVETLQQLTSLNSKWARWGKKLIENYSFLRTIEQLHQLVTLTPGSSLSVNSKTYQKIALLMHLGPEELTQKIKRIFVETESLVKDLDPRRG